MKYLEIILYYSGGPKSNERCPYKSEAEGDKTEEEAQCDYRGGDGKHVAQAQGQPPETERSKELIIS